MNQMQDQELRNLFNKRKRDLHLQIPNSIKNEDKKEFVIKLADFLCDDLIRRGKKKTLRPLSPHLPIYKPQLTSTFPISHRISGAFLATIVVLFALFCLKMGLICFTYENFYQFFFYSSKLILISVEITALALSYHLYNGVRHLLTDFSGFLRIGR